MKAVLGNMRWLCLPSESLGQDWADKGRQIDAVLSPLGMDLAEESVFILFSHGPSDILEGVGRCLIARSVIGPKKQVDGPFELIDFKAKPVWQSSLTGQTWEELLEQAEIQQLQAQKVEKSLSDAFLLRVRRSLGTELTIAVDLFYHE